MNRIEHGHGNKIGRHSPDTNLPTLRKVPATSVPYGESISRNGRTVWIAMEGDRVFCVAATSAEARRRFYDIRKSLSAGGGRRLKILPTNLKKTAANILDTRMKKFRFSDFCLETTRLIQRLA